MKKILLCIATFFLVSCAEESKPYSIAMDRNWFSLALNGQEANLNGFINDLLLEITKEKKIYFEIIDNNFDELTLDLKKKKYDAILSPIEPYNFNKAKYDFSKDIIKTGFVLITSKKANYKSLNDMSNKHVGYISDTGSVIFLQKYADIFEEPYTSIPTMLDAIVNGNTEGAILSIIPAYKYVSDLYQNELKIIKPPLNDRAIRLITLKDQNQDLLNLFNASLAEMENNNKLEELKKKWSLPH
ncbi:MAG: Arginine-binding extracellular protein ArtP [Candidatus Anoxychlamydiales bacterium]|nr:Arginine-binding extracellular protein ArtP [Candidatus Anoxychlamydiales bacterium]NGX40738.1 Arginine-binding extracellular protein ArtP [Candidatus Anoxychlamydiales bacterium]